MKSNSGRTWIPPSVTKLAIGAQTKSPVAIDPGTESERRGLGDNLAAEPLPSKAPAAKFGFSLEWSFPLAVRTD
jgi:hypothetical protein